MGHLGHMGLMGHMGHLYLPPSSMAFPLKDHAISGLGLHPTSQTKRTSHSRICLWSNMADDSTNRSVVNPLVRDGPTGFYRSNFTHEYSISCLRDILLKYLKPQGIPSCCQQGLGYLAQLLNHFCQSPICLI